MTQTDHPQSPGTMDAPARELVLWLLQAVGLRVHPRGTGGLYTVDLPQPLDEATLAAHPGRHLVGKRIAFTPGAGQPEAVPGDSAPAELVSWQSPLLQWLFAQLEPATRLLQAAAARQPMSVHELAEHLFAQYQVDGGQMHLAGCCLEDRPFLRLTYLQGARDGAAPRFVHCFGTDDGELLDAALRRELELDELLSLESRAPRVDESLVRRWTELIDRQFTAQVEQGGDLQLVAITLVWCKYAEGKLAFTIGKRVAELPFSGWGRMLASRRLLPPPYACPLSGRSSYHLAATDDGRITVAEAIGSCAESSQRVLASELSCCAVTHRKVLPEYLQECPCTGEQVLRSILQPCSICQQPVSPTALEDEQCLACRSLQPVPRDDPALAELLQHYPQLARLRNFKRAETRAVQIVAGHSTWKRLLVVFGKPDRQVVHLAIGGRFSRGWTTATDAQREDWLG